MVAALVRMAAVLLVGGVSAVQWMVTSPGVVTDLEFRALLLAAGPALTVCLTAGWAARGVSMQRGGDRRA